ncbi:UvrD-helicase domain-containing protein [Acinetobacter bereziniae]|uniref:UvrD-helicase domain-containing protein n=1 Tax=Acinetobacter bereziniae TaxID=106648 RepID=UPI0018DCE7AC|nr:ATP-dependent helicase [Acinetobacter bereziniae]MBI0395412.1 ATP-dependent helicase [Acinetobacter bereziniae]
MPITPIHSNTKLQNIEQHFKVLAGPGAGKTHWLVEHIKNVLHNSNRLGKIRKVACTTYTNIAVETILKRLGTSVEHVDVSTIHSFLYRHIVKPYANLIAHEYALNVAKLDGHDELYISYGKVNDWLTTTNQKYLLSSSDNFKIITDALMDLQWQFDNQRNLILKPRKPWLGKISKNVLIRNSSYIEYRKIYWNEGVIHHDDVLFFSHQIVERHPFVLKVLRSKFPYFFIDEFQDCNPIQLAILTKIGNEETIIGVIGDQAQSIYAFQGAEQGQLHSFNLTNMQEYEIANNKRSTIEIVSFLNGLRTDIIQHPDSQRNLFNPQLFIGDLSLCVQRASSICVYEKLNTLSRNNITSNALKIQIGAQGLDMYLFDKLSVDGTSERRNLLSRSVKAIELTRENKFKDAIKEIRKSFIDEGDSVSKSLKYLSNLLREYDNFKDLTLTNFVDVIRRLSNKNVARLMRGNAKNFYDTYSYKQLALCVSIPEDMSLHKTIHKSKGDEFDNVLLVLDSESDLDFILNPDLVSNEEHRIKYVAVSRAKNRLFISVPTLSTSNRILLASKLDITDCVLNES